MRSRLAKITRMVAVQRQVHRLAEWQLIELQRQEEDLNAQAHQLILTLNADVPLHGLFVESMAKRLSSIGSESAAVAKAKEAQSGRVLVESRKLRHAERLQDSTAIDVARHLEKLRLDEIVGNALLRGSLPSLRDPAQQSDDA
jgi:hypothetical protein